MVLLWICANNCTLPAYLDYMHTYLFLATQSQESHWASQPASLPFTYCMPCVTPYCLSSDSLLDFDIPCDTVGSYQRIEIMHFVVSACTVVYPILWSSMYYDVLHNCNMKCPPTQCARRHGLCAENVSYDDLPALVRLRLFRVSVSVQWRQMTTFRYKITSGYVNL